MDFKENLETSFQLTLQHIVPLLLITLVMGVVGMFTAGILIPVMTAGYIQSMLMLVRSGREPKVQDIFSEMRLFLPLLIFGVIVAIAVFVGFFLFFLPGFILSFAIAYVCLYMLPLMTDRGYDIVGAVKESYRMVSGADKIDHIIVSILVIAINMIGGSTVVGFLFTQPLATIFLVRAYEQKIHGTPPAFGTDTPADEPVPSDTSDTDEKEEIVLKDKL